MLKPKQLFIIIYVNVCMKRVYPHNNKQYHPVPLRKNSGNSIFRLMIKFAMIELGI